MKKSQYLLILILFNCSVLKENINGIYRLESKMNFNESNYGIIEITIKNDTVYKLTEYEGFKSDIDNYLNWKKRIKSGKVTRTSNRKFNLNNYSDSLNLEVKITKKKMIIFALNSNYKKTKSLIFLKVSEKSKNN